MRESKPERKIVLLGKTGDGKSSSGNTILSKEIFTTASSPESETDKNATGSAVVGGRKVTVIDTLGIFDTRIEEEVIKTEIVKSIIECAPAVDAFVIVLKVERYTRQEMEILDKIVEYCGEEIFKHAVFLFTHGDDLNGQTIEQFVQKSPKLHELVDKCRGRCHVIDNKHWTDCHLGYRSNKVQVKNLLDTIDKMVEENGQYTNELLLNVEEEIQEVMNSMLLVNLSTEEKREVANKIAVIRFAGAATGMLIGAFLGIGVAVASVVILFRAAKLTKVFKAISIGVTAAVDAGVAVETGAGSGIAVGVILGTAALAGAIGGGITGYKAAKEADSVLDAIKIAAEVNLENAKDVVKKAEELPSNVYKKFQ